MLDLFGVTLFKQGSRKQPSGVWDKWISLWSKLLFMSTCMTDEGAGKSFANRVVKKGNKTTKPSMHLPGQAKFELLVFELCFNIVII